MKEWVMIKKALWFALLVILVSCSQIPSTPPSQEMVTVKLIPYGTQLVYDATVSSSVYGDYGLDDWTTDYWYQEKKGITGEVVFTEVPVPLETYAKEFSIEPLGGYRVYSTWYDQTIGNNGVYTHRFPLVRVIKETDWRVVDFSSGSGYVARVSFTFEPIESELELEVNGDCEVYGDDYRFNEVITLERGATSMSISSTNATPYNNTSFECRFTTLPVAVDGVKLPEDILRRESIF